MLKGHRNKIDTKTSPECSTAHWQGKRDPRTFSFKLQKEYDTAKKTGKEYKQKKSTKTTAIN